MKYLITLLSILFLISCEPVEVQQERESKAFEYNYTVSTTDGGVVKIYQEIRSTRGIMIKSKPSELETIEKLSSQNVADNCDILIQDLQATAHLFVYKDGVLAKKCSKY